MALERLGFELNEDGARVLFQTCSRGRLGLMFGEFCAWYFPFSSFFASTFFVFIFHITFVPHRFAHSRCRYVSSQLESIAASKLGPLKLPTNRKSEPEHQPLPSPDRQAHKPRSSSADNGRASAS